MTSESVVDSMIVGLISSEKGSVSAGGMKGIRTAASETRNYINGSLTYTRITILHQHNDLRKRSRFDDLSPDIV